MRIDFQKKFLIPRSPQWGLGKREILRVITENSGVGELVSWPELGDPTLDEHLNSWKEGNPSFSMMRALEFSRLDFEAKLSGKSLLEDIPKLPLALYLGQVKTAGEILKFYQMTVPEFDLSDWKTVKIKMKGGDAQNDLSLLLESLKDFPVKLRVDFNFSLDQNGFCLFLGKLKAHELEQIEFFEDPFEYNWQNWEKISADFPVRLGLDRSSLDEKTKLDERWAQGTAPFLYVIGKPMIEDCSQLAESASLNMRRFVMTSSFGSKLESLQAAWVAKDIYSEHGLVMDSLGLTTHFLWEDSSAENPFTGFTKGFFDSSKISGAGWGIAP